LKMQSKANILLVMKNLELMSVEEILVRIGANLEEMRIESQVPDSQVLSRGGIKATTWTNLKAGRNVTIANLVKALRGLDRLHLIEPLVEYERPASPMDLVKDSGGGLKRRIHKDKVGTEEAFHWDDEP
jgi:hypothetical protein